MECRCLGGGLRRIQAAGLGVRSCLTVREVQELSPESTLCCLVTEEASVTFSVDRWGSGSGIL